MHAANWKTDVRAAQWHLWIYDYLIYDFFLQLWLISELQENHFRKNDHIYTVNISLFSLIQSLCNHIFKYSYFYSGFILYRYFKRSINKCKDGKKSVQKSKLTLPKTLTLLFIYLFFALQVLLFSLQEMYIDISTLIFCFTTQQCSHFSCSECCFVSDILLFVSKIFIVDLWWFWNANYNIFDITIQSYVWIDFIC